MEVSTKKLKTLAGDATKQAAKESFDIGFRKGVMSCSLATMNLADKYPELREFLTALAESMEEAVAQATTSENVLDR